MRRTSKFLALFGIIITLLISYVVNGTNSLEYKDEESYKELFIKFFESCGGVYRTAGAKNKDVEFKLRPITHEDTILIKEVFSDLRTRVLAFGRNIDLDGVVNFFIPPPSLAKPNHMLIFKNDEFIGRTILKFGEDRKTWFGISLKTEAQGKGYGTDITRIVLDLAFNKLGLDKVYGSALSYNTASQSLLSKIGMTPEGIEPKINGYDTYFVVFSMDKKTFQELDNRKHLTQQLKHPNARTLAEFQHSHDYKKSGGCKSQDFQRFLQRESPEFKNIIFISSLSINEIIESMPLLKYIYSEIFRPLLPDELVFYTDNLLNKTNSFDDNTWIATHLFLGLLATFHFQTTSGENPLSLAQKITYPLLKTSSYGIRLLAHDFYNNAITKRLQETQSEETQNDIHQCHFEAGISSLATAVSSFLITIIVPTSSIAYIVVPTLNSAAISYLQCLASQQKILPTSEEAFSAQTFPYIIDFLVLSTFSRHASLNFNNLNAVYYSLNQVTSLLSTFVLLDQLTKLSITLIPNEIFEKIDSYLVGPFN